MFGKKLSLVLFILFFAGGFTFAQSVDFDKSNFPSDKDNLKTAINDIKNGDEQFQKEYYDEAVEYYLKANAFNPENAGLNFKIGICYLKGLMRYKCLSYFEKAFQLDRTIAPDIHLMLGKGYQLNLKFESAINEFKAYQGILSADQLKLENASIERFISECDEGMELVAKPARAFVDNLSSVNSAYNDHSPLISADESMMIFTSTRNNGRKPFSDGQYDEDIYIGYNINKQWQPPVSIGEPINTQFNDATVGLSPDGQKLLIYNGNKGNGDIQICWLEGDEWNYPKSLPKIINSEYKESSACFSPDGNQFYFVSDRPGGLGGKDIYVTTKNKKDKWEEAENMGPIINSPFDEETVFMHPDGRTLYFSSEGHRTMGGFDIFVSRLDEKGNWTEPENLGYPVNSPDDDLCFVITANGRHGYCSSIRPDGLGGFDIYRMTFLGPEKPLMMSNEDNLIAVRVNPVSEMVMEQSVDIKTIRLTIVKGTVKDAITNEPVPAQIEIVDNDKNELIFTSQTNSSSGKFLVSLPSGKNYGLTVKADNYLFHSENFDIPAATEYQEISKDILLNNLKKDVKIVLKNVFFETGSAKLKPTSYAELGRLTLLLNEHPDLRIEISGHTDNQGSKVTNQKLSEARAKSVVDFLITEGIESSRLEYKGYAFDQPIAGNETSEGRAQNRRVEFKVLSN